MKKVAEIFSYIFHPIFVPIIGLAIIQSSNAHIVVFNKQLLWYLFIIVFISTVFIPVVILAGFQHFKLISGFKMDQQRERLLPYLVMFIFYYLTFLLFKNLFKQITFGFFIPLFFFICSISVLILFFINLFWKISAHMMGIGGITGLIIALSFKYNVDMMFYLIAAIFISGILATSRGVLKKHSLIEILSGFLLGILLIDLFIFIYPPGHL